ncbi:MAG: J domain-containing protein, partial [Patescibacteria group bacterium]
MTHYELLGVPMDASTVSITKAFRDKARALHPDRFDHRGESKDQQAERSRVFHELRAAYDTLKDKRKRVAYDRVIQVPQGLMGLVQMPQGRRAMARLLPRAPLQAREGEDHIVLVRAPSELFHSGGLVQMTGILPSELDPLLVPIGASDMPWATIHELGEPGENEGNRGDLAIFFVLT